MSFDNKISVILPVKNGGRYIKSCVQSFLKQKVNECEKELIIVNDHSTDDTLTVLRDDFPKTTELIIIQNNGTGIIDALQSGFSVSSGNFISRMDVDDIMPENKLQRLMEVLCTEDVTVATGKVKYFHYEKNEVGEGYLRYEVWLNDLVSNQSFYPEIYKECVVASPNWLIRKVDFNRAGGFIGRYPEDYDLVFRWYKMGYNIKGSEFVTHHWFDHGERASRNDEHYKENNFFDLKLHWFFALDYRPGNEILIYGAGNKGKYLAKKIIERGVSLSWCSNNKKKIGKDIYGIKLISDEEPIEEMKCQIIVAIAVEEDKNQIQKRLKNANLKEGQDYFFFS